ncbi:MAG: hypothetical protein ACI943_002934 [Gammaproteobacteria bacterium]|jgi:hypothetical protein
MEGIKSIFVGTVRKEQRFGPDSIKILYFHASELVSESLANVGVWSSMKNSLILFRF